MSAVMFGLEHISKYTACPECAEAAKILIRLYEIEQQKLNKKITEFEKKLNSFKEAKCQANSPQ